MGNFNGMNNYYNNAANMNKNVEDDVGLNSEVIDVLRIALKDYKEGKYCGIGSGDVVLTDDYWKQVEKVINRFDNKEGMIVRKRLY